MTHASPRFPAHHRPTNLLGPIDILVEHAEGEWKLNPNELILALLQGRLDPLQPVAGLVSAISGDPAVRFSTSEVEIPLSVGELRRLAGRNLAPWEFFVLADNYGSFHEIHDDFYDEDTGLALQPIATEPGPDIAIRVSAEGDRPSWRGWV